MFPHLLNPLILPHKLPNMKPLFLLTISLLFISCNQQSSTPAPTYDETLLNKVRSAGMAIPGSLPASIHYIKYASSIRKWSDIVEDGGDDPCTMARTAFQIVFEKSYIMVDAGMDRAVHHFFEKDSPQPFDDTVASRVAAAVQNAQMILVTHEHGDHVAGVIRNASDAVAAKTMLTSEQIQTLINEPQMPEIKLDENRAKQYINVSFESVLPVAPGVVLIKAPGHTAGEIMVYTRLQHGKEYIFTGDVTWSFKGVQEKKPKPSSERKRIGEEGNLVEDQLAWLHERLNRDKMVILVSHDDIMLPQYAAQGLITPGLMHH